ncbi:dipeptide epimerase [Zeaxanthinibacter sp. PT1]|uniref:mandelate racemase/muconate lactonizing enzyme family protein n=1 Tax=Zeaxanthinibacter TaxID=561554 RepID=UPI00234BF7E5|nr:dipeptide epimerase [Zeaxanthinibacter sp. PT1]MDC6350174.1 dipeptide epimerase [Zeaxanthinibacter sp. PT1]
MKITKVTYQRLDLKLSEPYTIAYETVSSATNFILKLETDTGLAGYGCACPDGFVTGETNEEVTQAIKEIISPYLKQKDPFTYALIIEELKRMLPGKSSTLAMVDIALFDLVSKKAGVPLYKFLGGYKSSIPTSVTIGILPVADTIAHAREWVKAGFFVLKVKGGKSLEEDVEKMTRLREVFPDVLLRFDGNQGYSVAEAISFVRQTATVGIEIFEQPTRVGGEESLGEVTQHVTLPVMADESIKTLADAFRLAQNERVDMVNIKIMKVGGIMEALHINSVAKSAGLEAMVGCIDECSLGIAAGLHFALSRANVEYADLDGHMDIIGDPFKGLFRLKDGILYPGESPGLGDLSGYAF